VAISLALNHSAGGPPGRLASPQKKKWNVVIACIYSVPSAIGRGDKRIEMRQKIDNFAEKSNYKKFSLAGSDKDPVHINIPKRG